MKNTPNRIRSQGDDETMRFKSTGILRKGVFVALVALVVSAAFAATAGAAPAWKFENKALTGTESETVVGAAVESSLTVPGLTTKCENFLYKLTIKDKEGTTGEGSLTELPLFNCTTNSKFCTVEAIAAENLPWASHLTKVETSNYIIIEGVKVAIYYAGELCVLGETLVTVTGKAGGLLNNESETATFGASSFKATGTELKALGQKIEWNGVFPTEAFQWHREQALTVS
jgi:hypothetical protein